MLSRIADSLYWMSRYLERVDNTARLIEINLLHLLEAEEDLPEYAQWQPLLVINGAEPIYAETYPDGEVTAGRVLHFLVQESANPGSLRASLRSARENARVVRDRISGEMWETVNELWLALNRRLKEGPLTPERATVVFREVRDGVARLHGQADGTMMRGEAHAFFSLGTYVERADMTARILDVKYHLLLPDLAMVGSPLDYYQWAALLKSMSAFDAFRRRYQAGLRPRDVAEFVLFEQGFPRSLRFAVERLSRTLAEIGGNANGVGHAAAGLRDYLTGVTTDEVFHDVGLHEFLHGFLERAWGVNDALAGHYFQSYLEV